MSATTPLMTAAGSFDVSARRRGSLTKRPMALVNAIRAPVTMHRGAAVRRSRSTSSGILGSIEADHASQLSDLSV